MQIRWSEPAAADLERICAWIERDNPEAARRVAQIVYEGCSSSKIFRTWESKVGVCLDAACFLFRRCLTSLSTK
jgi:hypothetical protein